jgi:hypothetical protein
MLERIELRVAGLQAIDPLMTFGDDRDLKNIAQLIEQLRNKISAYNTALSVIDSSKAEIHTLETTLNDLAEKMLIGVAFKYGKDSSEYEMAGGVKKSDRIRRSTASRLKAKAEEVSATAL